MHVIELHRPGAVSLTLYWQRIKIVPFVEFWRMILIYESWVNDDHSTSKNILDRIESDFCKMSSSNVLQTKFCFNVLQYLVDKLHFVVISTGARFASSYHFNFHFHFYIFVSIQWHTSMIVVDFSPTVITLI